MGKKQHSKDQLYVTPWEWTNLFGGKNPELPASRNFRRLPFNHCALSLQPFVDPYCSVNTGVIYDLLSIVPYVKKYKQDPTSGEPLEAKDLLKLNLHKNSEGELHCPITFKVFTDNSHIVAIRTSGNVFAFDAVDRLNIKPKHWKDLITDEVFVRKDIITLQDPQNLDKFNISTYHHVQENRKATDDDGETGARHKLRFVNNETESVLKELDETYKSPEASYMRSDNYSDPSSSGAGEGGSLSAAHYSTGGVAAGLTSTVMPIIENQRAATVDESIVRYQFVDKKGYVRLVTNMGDLNLEVFCEQVPKTCENFVRLCATGYYDGSRFHRLIRNFMVQGGKPEGLRGKAEGGGGKLKKHEGKSEAVKTIGKGGETCGKRGKTDREEWKSIREGETSGGACRSFWGAPFKDEFKPNLQHSGRGVLSMANHGPDTNTSQFFITFRSCQHLDNKHTVFGRLVGGVTTLDTIEKVATDDKDRPNKDIYIVSCRVFVDPFEEADVKVKELRDKEAEAVVKKKLDREKPFRKVDSKPEVFSSGVGKYISHEARKRFNDDDSVRSLSGSVKISKVVGKSTFDNFDSW